MTTLHSSDRGTSWEKGDDLDGGAAREGTEGGAMGKK